MLNTVTALAMLGGLRSMVVGLSIGEGMMTTVAIGCQTYPRQVMSQEHVHVKIARSCQCQSCSNR